jgi:hypothetical protein
MKRKRYNNETFIKTAKQLAFRDIYKYLEEEYKELIKDRNSWVVNPYYLDNKYTRRLNRELGVSRVNYLGNRNKSK